MDNSCVEIDGIERADWECKAAKMASDPATGQALKKALAESLEQDPVDAVKSAEAVYQILLERALAQPAGQWKWRSHNHTHLI